MDNFIIEDKNKNVYAEYVWGEIPIYDGKMFKVHIDEKIAAYNRLNNTCYKRKDFAKKMGISDEHLKKIINLSRTTTKRDYIIALCIVLEMDRGETDETLQAYPGMSALDEYARRDKCIIEILDELPLDIDEVNKRLVDRHFAPLNISTRGKQKVQKHIEKREEKYIVLGYRIRSDISEYYYKNQYNSLTDEYSPENLHVTAEMMVKKKDDEKNYRLIVSTDGRMVVNDIDKEHYDTYYADTCPSELEFYFDELINKADNRRKELLNNLNDTRNYKKRVSALVVKNSIKVFAEEYNFVIPELGEYYYVEYYKQKYSMKVYKDSMFMFNYLGDDQYKLIYGDEVQREIESYESVDEIELIQAKISTSSDRWLLLDLRKKCFIKLMQDIDILLEKIRNRKEFVVNILATEIDPMRYYEVENEFNCEYGECGELISYDDEHTFDNGDTSIAITAKELLRAAELGLSSINEIISAKNELIDLDNILK